MWREGGRRQGRGKGRVREGGREGGRERGKGAKREGGTEGRYLGEVGGLKEGHRKEAYAYVHCPPIPLVQYRGPYPMLHSYAAYTDLPLTCPQPPPPAHPLTPGTATPLAQYRTPRTNSISTVQNAGYRRGKWVPGRSVGQRRARCWGGGGGCRTEAARPAQASQARAPFCLPPAPTPKSAPDQLSAGRSTRSVTVLGRSVLAGVSTGRGVGKVSSGLFSFGA
eukprot:1589563-Rhodomonas_salina.1